MIQPNARSTSHLPRNNSSVRVHQKDSPAIKRPSTHTKQQQQQLQNKHKVGFTLSTPDPDQDDDEWVSSESGAATPANDSDTDRAPSPVQHPAQHLVQPPIITKSHSAHSIPFGPKDDVAQTPKAIPSPLPRVDTIRPLQQHPMPPPLPTPPPDAAAFNGPTLHAPAQPQRQQLTPHHQQQQPFPSSLPKARSETHSPPRRSPDHILKRQSMTRPPSTHSITSKDTFSLRPHPLIRAHSHGYGQQPPSSRLVPLAPLTTVLDDTVLSTQYTSTSSTSSPTSQRAVSPSLSLKTSSASPVLSQASPTTTTSDAHRQLRRTSTSSARSTATMPNIHPSSSFSHYPSQDRQSAFYQQYAAAQGRGHDRQRTLSSSSTFAQALSNFALRSSTGAGSKAGTPSPPPYGLGARGPPKVVVKFASHALDGYHPQHQHSGAHALNGSLHSGSTAAGAGMETMHPLLPPPYLSAHLTVLAWRNPLAESYERVVKAKQAL